LISCQETVDLFKEDSGEKFQIHVGDKLSFQVDYDVDDIPINMAVVLGVICCLMFCKAQ
jgi:hypothetical protein